MSRGQCFPRPRASPGRWRLNALHAVYRWLRAVHRPAHLQAKAEDLGRFSVVATIITSLFVVNTWIWDYAIDLAGMRSAFWLRVAEGLAVLALAGVMAWSPTGLLARVGLFLVPAFVQITFIEILARLDGGASYGIGGFLYFFIFLPFMAQAQSLRFNMLLLAAVALFPNLLRLAGIGEHLNLAVYNAYVWMVYPPIVMILGLAEYLHQTRFRQHQGLVRTAVTDALTGLPNRHYFDDKGRQVLDRCRSRGEPLTVMFIDADHFKAVNDAHGHTYGDRLLRMLAGRLRRMLRQSDIIARYGGEEFVVVMPATSSSMAWQVAERIRQHVAETPFQLGAPVPPIRITVSAGLATREPGDTHMDLRELLHAADNALYSAKRDGRDRVRVWGGGDPAE